MCDLNLLKELCKLSYKERPLSTKANSVIYLHPSTMKSLNLMKDSWVYVGTNEGPLALKCWPCDALQTFNASLHSTILNHYMNCSITITTLLDSFGAIKNLFLCPKEFNSFMISQDFHAFLENELSQLYLREELEFHFTYIGYPCQLTVQAIEPKFPKTLKKLDDSCKHLNDSFFNITEESQTSTPISTKKCSSKMLHRGIDHWQRTASKHLFMTPSSKIVIVRNIYDTAEKITFEDIVGLDENIDFIKSAIAAILHPCTGYRLLFPRGIILVGPPGSGKSMIAQSLQNESDLPVHIINLQDMKSFEEKDVKSIKEAFVKAHYSSPSIMFLDGLDQVFMKKDSTIRSLREEAFIKKFVYLIHSTLNSSSDILIFAVARNENTLPSYVKKIFSKVLQFSINSAGRKKILMKILQNFNHSLTETDINEIVDLTNGCSGGELLQSCKTAKETTSNEKNTMHASFSLIDLKKIVMQMKPTIPINFEIPIVKWSDVGGMENVKGALTKMVEWPLTRAHLFKKFKIPAPRGILLYGPPGCCKTMIAQALVNEYKFNFIPVKASELFNKYVGESEKSVSELFKKARASAPCVLFFDEVDSLTSTRGSTSGNSNVCDRILTQLLVEMDGIDTLEGVCILAATNRPDIMDPSFLRPGRFDQRIYVGLPDPETRQKIFEVKLCKLPVSSDVDISYLVHSTDGYSGAEIATVCLEASKYAMKEHIASASSEITMKHFAEALRNISPKTTNEMKQFFKLYEERQNFLAK